MPTEAGDSARRDLLALATALAEHCEDVIDTQWALARVQPDGTSSRQEQARYSVRAFAGQLGQEQAGATLFELAQQSGNEIVHDTAPMCQTIVLCLAWRDAVISTLTEQARRLGSAPEALDHAIVACWTTSDAFIVKMTEHFDIGRRELASRLEQRTAELVRLAYRDPLTGLANRSRFFEELERASGSPIAVLYVDLDDFKKVNDQHGHAVGDGLLRAVAQRLRHHVRDQDFVARLGGDEFSVLISDAYEKAPTSAVVARADGIRAALAQPFTVLQCRLELSASIGIGIHQRALDTDALLAEADKAMYRAKRAGGDRCEVAEMPSLPT